MNRRAQPYKEIYSAHFVSSMGNKQGAGGKKAPARASQTNRKQEKEAMKICTLRRHSDK